MEVLFNNNFKFNQKNSASPSLCLYSKNINITTLGNYPSILNIINTLNYKDDDFKYFFKIWPNINDTIISDDHDVNKSWIPIRNMWIKNWKTECGGLEYEKKVYHLLDDVKDDNYTVTPILSDSNNSKISDFAGLLGNFKEGDENFNLFLWIFIKWLKDPDEPSVYFNYKSESLKAQSLSYGDKKLIDFISANLTFSCIMTPVIMGDNVTTFKRVIKNIEKNLSSGTNPKIVMSNFCDVFVNIVKGIKNLKERNIAHNDLHYNNIFVQRLPDNTYNTFIYDFDRSYSPKLGYNPVLNDDICEDLCTSTQCNKYDNWLDFFKILHYILDGILDIPNILLFLNIITGNPTDFDFLPFIGLMVKNAFFTNPNTDCSWYWDEELNVFGIKEKVGYLLKNYDTVIQRLDAYRKQSKSSFSFVAPPDNKNYSLFENKQLTNKPLANKLFENKQLTNKQLTNKQLTNKQLTNKQSAFNKLSIDLITGKYIDLSIKKPQLVSTLIDTIKKFDDVIKENNQQKAILRKKAQSKRK
jgi:hypothetical protein